MPFWMLGYTSFDRFLFPEQRISRVDDKHPLAANITSNASEILRRIMHRMFVSGAQNLTLRILM
jgi:hypothetical protein